MKRISLAALRIRPRINLSPETREVFTWKEMRAPLSVTFASALAMVSSMLYEFYHPKADIQLKASAVIATTLLIMGEMGTSEKFYLKTTLRVVGVVTGVALGVVYALFEKMLEDYLGINNSAAVAKGASLDYNPNEWILILFRVLLISPTIFVCCVFMKLFPKYSYAINVLAIHCPMALLARTFIASLGITFAALLAVSVAVVSLILLDRFTTETLLTDTNRVCITGVLSVFQLAASGDPDERDQFLKHSDSVHKSISSAESAFEVYAQWRGWTCRSVIHDFKELVKPTRPLFYQAYSLYWSNVAAYHALEYRADILFCKDTDAYEKHFKNLVDDLVISIELVKVSLAKLFNHPQMVDEEMDAVFDEIIVSHLWNGIVRVQEDMKRQSLKLRKSVFSTFGQRWNMTDYLRQMALMTHALVEYIRAMAVVFQKPDRHFRLNKVLDQLADGLDLLRKEDEAGLMANPRFLSALNPAIYAAAADNASFEFDIAKSTSSPELMYAKPRINKDPPTNSTNEDLHATETSSLLPRDPPPANR